MGIADRIILTLYTILMAVASVLTLLCSLGVFSDTGMVAFISHIPGNWVYAVGGVIMLLVSLRLLIEPGINIPETSGEIKTNVRETIKKVTGIEVKDIELFFKQIKAKEE